MIISSRYHVVREHTPGEPCKDEVVGVIEFDEPYKWTFYTNFVTRPVTPAEYDTLIAFGIRVYIEEELGSARAAPAVT